MSPGTRHEPGRPREPIRYGWFWLGVLTLVAAGSPWYLRPGTLEPILLGLPRWVWVSIVLSLVFCGYVRWACLRLWRIVEGDERGPASGEGDG